MRVAIYTRVSTEDQAREGTSLDVQKDYLLDYAKKEGLKVYYPEKNKMYEDDGYSGYSTDRPALKRLRVDARNRKFDMVLVHKIDRFSRNLMELLNLVDELEKYNISFKSATEFYDTTTSAGRMMLQQLGSFAEFERNRIKERVFPGMLRGVAKGNWQGARYSPYGYHYNKEKKLLEVAKNEVDVVKLIYTMYLANQSTAQIAGYLFKKDYKTRSGGKFHNKLVCDILKNQIYLGKIVWNRHHYDKKQKTRKGCRYIKNDPSKVIVAEGRHEAIIAEEDFLLVQDKMKANKKGVMHRANVKEYPLSGILYCGQCDHKYLGAANISNHREKIKKRWYRCNARQVHFIKCPNPSIRAEILEPQIYAILELLVSHPELRSMRVENFILVKGQVADENLDAEKRKLKKQLRINLEKQNKLNESYLENLIAIEVYRDKSTQLREEEKMVKNAIAKVDMQLVEKEKSNEYARLLKRVIENFEETKSNIDIVAKKELLQLIVKKVTVNDGKIEKIELFEPFKRFYEELKCSIKQTKTSRRENSYILEPSAVR